MPATAFDYLVTGAAGYIGQKLCKALRAADQRVLAIDIKQPKASSLVSDPGFVFRQADLSDYPGLCRVLDTKCRAAFHLAGQPFVWFANMNPREDCMANVLGTVNLLECMRSMGIPRIVYASTGDVYTNTYMADESSATSGSNFYGLSKSTAENYIRMFAKYHQMQMTIVRMALVYGPGFNRNVLYDIISGMKNNLPISIKVSLDSEYDMLYVTDAVCGLTQALAESWAGRTVNLSTGIGVSVNTMIETASALFGKKAVVVGEVKDIVRKVYLNNLARTLGWKPLVFFPDGCREVFRMGYRVGDGTDDNH